MKVIKRDGRTVEYDRNKILVAIRKANAEVDQFEKVSDDAIDGIIAIRCRSRTFRMSSSRS